MQRECECVHVSELKCRSIQSHFPRQAFGCCIVRDPFGKLNGILLSFIVHGNYFPQSSSVASLFCLTHNTRPNQFAISREILCISALTQSYTLAFSIFFLFGALLLCVRVNLQTFSQFFYLSVRFVLDALFDRFRTGFVSIESLVVAFTCHSVPRVFTLAIFYHWFSFLWKVRLLPSPPNSLHSISLLLSTFIPVLSYNISFCCPIQAMYRHRIPSITQHITMWCHFVVVHMSYHMKLSELNAK